MCRPYILRFWSPFTTISAEHERNIRPRNPPSNWKPRHNRGDHIYYYVSCRDDKTVLAEPLCPINACPSTPYSAPRNRTKDFCKDDETCRKRIASLETHFNELKNRFLKNENAFVKDGGKVFLRDAVKIPWWEWCSAYEQHLLCPERRVSEYVNDYSALLRTGIAKEGELMPLEQRMGKDPRRYDLAFI